MQLLPRSLLGAPMAWTLIQACSREICTTVAIGNGRFLVGIGIEFKSPDPNSASYCTLDSQELRVNIPDVEHIISIQRPCRQALQKHRSTNIQCAPTHHDSFLVVSSRIGPSLCKWHPTWVKMIDGDRSVAVVRSQVKRGCIPVSSIMPLAESFRSGREVKFLRICIRRLL
jgi:hypothetical protein